MIDTQDRDMREARKEPRLHSHHLIVPGRARDLFARTGEEQSPPRPAKIDPQMTTLAIDRTSVEIGLNARREPHRDQTNRLLRASKHTANLWGGLPIRQIHPTRTCNAFRNKCPEHGSNTLSEAL